MHTVRKRLLAMLLTLAMVISLFPVTALADAGEDAGSIAPVEETSPAEDISPVEDAQGSIAPAGEAPDALPEKPVADEIQDTVASGECGDNLTWTLDENGLLSISGTGAMWNFDYNGSPWCDRQSDIKSVFIPSGVISIGDYAFQSCDSLTEITIPDGVTGIGKWAFISCSNLTSVSIPSSVTDIGLCAFQSCTRIQALYIDDLDWWLALLESNGDTLPYGDLVLNGEPVTEITIPEGTLSLRKCLFRNLRSLQKVYLPESLREIEDFAFSGITRDYSYCSSPIRTIFFLGDAPSIASYAFVSYAGNNARFHNVNAVALFPLDNASWTEEVRADYGAESLTWVGYRDVPALYTVRYDANGGENAPAEQLKGHNVDLTLSESLPDRENFTFLGWTADPSATEAEYAPGGIYSGNADITLYALWGADVPAPEIVASGECGAEGDNLTWTLDENGLLTISGNGEMADWTSTSNPWKNNCSDILSVVIEPGATSIGGGAFSGCSNLAAITIPDSVASIAGYAFYECSSLTSVTIPEGVTAIEASTFNDCKALASVTIPDSVTSIGAHAFYGCSSLTSVAIPDNVTSIGEGAFASCRSLTSVTIPEGVVTIQPDTFNYCDALESISLPSTLTSIEDSAFFDCFSLTSISIPDNVTTIGRTSFYLCTSLSDLIIPDRVATIGESAFQQCTSLTTVIISDSVATIGLGAFAECSALTSVKIGSGVTSIKYGAFAADTSLTEVRFEGSAPSFEDSVFYGDTATAYYPGNDPSWTEEVRQNYGGTITWVAEAAIIASGACGENLTWTLDENGLLTISGTGKMWNTQFGSVSPWNEYLSRITSLVVMEGATSIGNSTFKYCSNLTEALLPAGIESIGEDAFYGCSSLAEITIRDGLQTIGNGAFNGCSSLTEVSLPEGLTSIGYNAFYRCTSLTEITIPEGVTRIESSTFRGCSALTKATLPEGLLYIESEAFSSCTAMTECQIPESVLGIGRSAFNWCSSLQSAMIPEGVTSLASDTFRYCSSLKLIVLPLSLSSVSNTFDCAEQADVIYGGTVEQRSLIDYNGVSGSNLLSTATWHYGKGRSDLVPITVEACDHARIAKQLAIRGEKLLLWILPDAGYCVERVTVNGSEVDLSSYRVGQEESLHVIITMTERHSGMGIVASGTCGSAMCWTLYSNGELVISGYDKMSSHPWTSYADMITSIVMEGDITSLCMSAFEGCKYAESVQIPESVTSIGNYAFRSCSTLVSVTLPEGLTVLNSCIFESCSSLSSVTLPAGLTSIGDYAFRFCKALETIDIPENVKSIGLHAFYGSGLTSVIIPCGVTAIGNGAFSYCDKLIDITLPSSVASVGEDAFSVTTEIYRRIYIDDLTWWLNFSSMSRKTFPHGDLFIQGQLLENAVIPDGMETLRVGAFCGCISLRSLILPESIRRVREAAFADCVSLTDVFYAGSEAQRQQITVDETDNEAFSGANWHYGWDSSDSIPVTIEPSEHGWISVFAARGEKLVISSHPDVGYVLQSISVNGQIIDPETYEPGGEESLIVAAVFVEHKPGGTFSHSGACGGQVNWVFYDDGELYIYGYGPMEIRIDKEGTELNELRPSITRVVVEQGVCSVNDLAFYCGAGTRIQSVVLPSTVTSIGTSAFQNCYGLQHIVLHSGIVRIKSHAFSGCSSVARIDIDDLSWWLDPPVDDPNADLPHGSLYLNGEALTEVVIPEAFSVIRPYAFSDCDTLERVVLSESTTSIGDRAFQRCYQLKTIVFQDTAPAMESSCFLNSSAFALYPVDDTSYTEAYRSGSYGGSLTWIGYRDVPAYYTLRYDLNGGSGSIPAEQLKGHNVDLTLREILPDREDFVFLGWAADPSATEAEYVPGGVYSGNADVTLYAVWEPEQYTISFDANGGEGAPEAVTKTYSQPLTLPETQPTRADDAASSFTVTLDPAGGTLEATSLEALRTNHYSFQSWNTQVNGYGISYAPGGSYTAEEGATLYAQWSVSTTTAPVELPTPVRDRYVFKGWYVEGAAESGITGSFTPDSDVTLFAIWERIPDGILTLENTGGRQGTEITIPVSLSANPGISYTRMRVSYDHSLLECLGVEDGSLTGWSLYSGSGILQWESGNLTDNTASGTILTLRFRIQETAEDGDTTVTLTVIEAFNIAEQEILLEGGSATVTVSSRLPGDSNGDDQVDIRDLVRLRKHLAEEHVDINLLNADVTGDGKVNGQDLLRLRKYLAGDPTGILK